MIAAGCWASSAQGKTDAPPDKSAAEAAKTLASLQSMARPFKKIGLVVSLETDSVKITITSNTEGTIVGRFVADFDKGSQNTEREFRGKIEGSFSVGIVSDEAQGDEDLPEDSTSLLPTDWFIASARAGIDKATMGQMMTDAISSASDGAEAGSAGSRGAGGSLTVDGDPPVCEFGTEAEFRMALDRCIKQFKETVPGITPENLRTMREALLAQPETTKEVLCGAGFGPSS